MTIKHLFPVVKPTLNLDFANQLALDPRITFTRSSTGTYVDKNGIIRTAAEDEPRFDYDPETGKSLGLLMEESRTNEFPYSEDFSTSSWNNVNTTVTTNAAIAPDGTSTANRLQIGDTDGGIYDNTVGAVASNSTISMWVKSVNPDIDDVFRLTCAGDFSGDLTATNEWVRYTFTSSTTTSSLHGIIRPADNTATDIYVWGAQFEEEKTFPTSYIPTAGTTEARAADVASITGTNFSSWYNQSEGTMFAQAKISWPLSTNTFPATYTSGSFPNRLWILYVNGGVNRLTVGADTHNGVLETFSTSPQSFKVAQALSNSNLSYSASKDGNAVLTGALSKAITDITSIALGSGPGGIHHISRLAYYPRRLSDEQLQALTA